MAISWTERGPYLRKENVIDDCIDKRMHVFSEEVEVELERHGRNEKAEKADVDGGREGR